MSPCCSLLVLGDHRQTPVGRIIVKDPFALRRALLQPLADEMTTSPDDLRQLPVRGIGNRYPDQDLKSFEPIPGQA
jgi:hypothetical protein